MPNVLADAAARCRNALLLLLAMLIAGSAFTAGQASGAEMRLAALGANRPLHVAPEIAANPNMTPLPKMAQARCPGGQLVFLSRACGCNGACCLCSREAPYLNHCTCRCEALPTPCAQGHSAGRP